MRILHHELANFELVVSLLQYSFFTWTWEQLYDEVYTRGIRIKLQIQQLFYTSISNKCDLCIWTNFALLGQVVSSPQYSFLFDFRTFNCKRTHTNGVRIKLLMLRINRVLYNIESQNVPNYLEKGLRVDFE